MSGLSERLWYLELQNKALKKQLAGFKSGNAYTRLRKEYESCVKKAEKPADLKMNCLKRMRRSLITETIGFQYMRIWREKPGQPLKVRTKK